ncbi:MAG: polysaccharide biosynthesis protein [Elainella sp. Prado103]|jgi:FlaA1/EpsC-like NDP-sugar epimerase|nr:polysaccharide biosynthesis protein [Elainella sp. Prado103]
MAYEFLNKTVDLKDYLVKLRNRHLLILDIILFIISPLLALSLRLDGEIALHQYGVGLLEVIIWFVPLKLMVLYFFGFYRRCWRYASIEELQQLVAITAIIAIGQVVTFNALRLLDISAVDTLPRSLPFLDAILSILLLGGLRFSIRLRERFNQRQERGNHWCDRVLIVGAGNAGIALVQEMQRNPHLGFRPVAFIDDDPSKLNLRIGRLSVVGDRYKIPQYVQALRIRRVIIAIPSTSGQVIREILDICHSIGVPTSTLPGIDEILGGRVRLSNVREIQIEDLLRREPVQMNVQQVASFIQGKKVLVTGAGGSIGSELCRQILKFSPAEIALIGHGENSVFLIQQELEKALHLFQDNYTSSVQRSTPRLLTYIADVRFRDRLKYVFEQFKPDVVFHAAAHKHVPMMELNSPEAITNNVQGTQNLVDLSLQFGVHTFVMISTDKAVNPTNIMGASKRVAEMMVLQAAQKSQRRFVVVRFGNVLGSRGSVVPTFKRQIAEGGPVTVTHPDMTRYFMTIPEAVQLVLQAAVISQGGEVLMLNMGQPVKILDLAKELIRLSGYEVGKDIQVAFTGLRPGEKLFEELFIPGEQYEPTDHEKLLIVKNASGFVPTHLDVTIKALCHAAVANDPNLIIFLLEQLVPGYNPQYFSSLSHLEGRNSRAIQPVKPEPSSRVRSLPRSGHLPVHAIDSAS